MGKTVSKEEIVIAQAGNSGGATTGAENGKGKNYGYSLLEVCAIVGGMLSVVAVGIWLWRRSRKALERKIRMEIRRSQELM